MNVLFLIVTMSWFFPLEIRKYVILIVSLEFLEMTNSWRISELVGGWDPEQSRQILVPGLSIVYS